MAAPMTAVGRPPAVLPARIAGFLDQRPELATPFLVIDLDVVRERYESLRSALPFADVYFAVKANPDPEVVGLLAELGSNFDVASVGEIDLCLRLGVDASRLSYGNTIKKARDIAAAYARGVRIFAADSIAELDKIRAHCPDGTVLVRVSTDGCGADWPLSRKFGCTPAEAEVMLLEAADQGLGIGVSFHVGSQQRDPGAWHAPLAVVADLAASLAQYGHRLSTVNLGGGLPSSHFAATPAIDVYGREIDEAVRATLGAGHGLDVMVEPGPLPGRRCRRAALRGRPDHREGDRCGSALGVPRRRHVQRAYRDAGRGDPVSGALPERLG